MVSSALVPLVYMYIASPLLKLSVTKEGISGYDDGERWKNDLGHELPETNVVLEGGHAAAFGYKNIASGNSSLAFGFGNIAAGDRSAAFGLGSVATANTSFAFGYLTKASGFLGVAFGNNNSAAGDTSVSFGHQTFATGDFSASWGLRSAAGGDASAVFGRHSMARSYCEFVVGMFNEWSDVGGEGEARPEDAMFRVGIGEDEDNLKDGLTVFKDGRVVIHTLEAKHDARADKVDAKVAALEADRDAHAAKVATLEAALRASTDRVMGLESKLGAIEAKLGLGVGR